MAQPNAASFVLDAVAPRRAFVKPRRLGERPTIKALSLACAVAVIGPWMLAQPAFAQSAPVQPAAQVAPQAAAESASRIERVTVYPGLAVVERQARVVAGARELVLDCLSPNFDLGSLQVQASEGVRVGPVSATNRPRAEVPACSRSPLDAPIRSLEDRLALLRAESSGYDLSLNVLRSLGAPELSAAPAAAGGGSNSAGAAVVATPSTTSARPLQTNASQLQALLATVKHSGQDALTQQHRLQREMESLEQELRPLLAERERQLGQAGEVRQLRIALSAAREGSLSLRYQVSGPSWAPAYRAKLEGLEGEANPSVLLERLAQVSQRSGEDWQGVALRLSTGSPRSATAGQEPRPWTLQPRPPLDALPQFKAAMAAAPAPAPMMLARSAAPESPELEFAVKTSDGEFATEFELPGKVDIGSGGERVSLGLGEVRLPASVRVRSVPRQEASAWLLAEIQRPEGIWPRGPLQLQRGAQVVGNSVWQAEASDKLSLPFGKDELVRVRVLPVRQNSAQTGFTGSRTERSLQQVYEVENRHRKPVALELVEAGPVSLDNQIEVSRQFSPAPQPGDWQEQPGMIAWASTLAPGQTARFSADYRISHPKDLVVQERR